MAHLLTLGWAAEHHRRPGSPEEGRVATALTDNEFSLLKGSDGFDRVGRSYPVSAGSSYEWQVPLPPVRFPLRDALLSVQQEPMMGSMSMTEENSRGPLVIKTNAKFKTMREVGRQRRHGQLAAKPHGYVKPPSELLPPKHSRPDAPKAMHSFGTISRYERQHNAEMDGFSTWGSFKESASAPALPSASSDDANRATWTSAARAVLSHSRRQARAAQEATRQASVSVSGSERAFGHASEPSVSSSWSPEKHAVGWRGLPRPVQAWASGGLEFTEKGMGIGERFKTESLGNARKSPGPCQYFHDEGSVATWIAGASLPTKQPCSQHHSTQVYKIGVKHEGRTNDWDRSRPGPGTYEPHKGFADEIMSKTFRKNKAAGVTQSTIASTADDRSFAGDASPAMSSHSRS